MMRSSLQNLCLCYTVKSVLRVCVCVCTVVFVDTEGDLPYLCLSRGSSAWPRCRRGRSLLGGSTETPHWHLEIHPDETGYSLLFLTHTESKPSFRFRISGHKDCSPGSLNHPMFWPLFLPHITLRE